MKVWRYDLIPDEGWEQHGHAPGEPGSGYEATPRFTDSDGATIEMPRGAEILSYNITTKGVSLYALVEGVTGGEQDPANRRFFVCGNDCDVPENVSALHYRATAKVTGGVTAHVFELTHVEAGAEAS